MENRITVVLPTYNRPECVDYYVNNSIAKYKGNLFCFEIHDSSNNDNTKNVIDDINSKLENKIKYYRYESNLNGDNKTHIALSNVSTDYMYLIGDGLSPDFNDLENKLINNSYDKYDLIGIFGKSFRYTKEISNRYFKDDFIYEENDLNFAFEQLTLCFTLYGASIVSKRMLNYINQNNYFEKFKFGEKYSYAHCLSLYEALLTNNFKLGISFIEVNINPMKKGNWAHDENFYKVFYEEFDTDIDKLSNYSKKSKNKCLKNVAKYHFSYKSIIGYRFKNVFTIKYLIKYKPYVKRCSNHYWFMWFVAFIPKWMWFIIYYPLKGCKRLIKKILRRG